MTRRGEHRIENYQSPIVRRSLVASSLVMSAVLAVQSARGEDSDNHPGIDRAVICVASQNTNAVELKVGQKSVSYLVGAMQTLSEGSNILADPCYKEQVAEAEEQLAYAKKNHLDHVEVPQYVVPIDDVQKYIAVDTK